MNHLDSGNRRYMGSLRLERGYHWKRLIEQNSKESREGFFSAQYNVFGKELRRMKEQVLAVQRMQDYIEKNKAEEIS